MAFDPHLKLDMPDNSWKIVIDFLFDDEKYSTARNSAEDIAGICYSWLSAANLLTRDQFWQSKIRNMGMSMVEFFLKFN